MRGPGADDCDFDRSGKGEEKFFWKREHRQKFTECLKSE